MNPPKIFQQYQLFKAHNRYNYPIFFMLIGLGKTVCQLGVVSAIAMGAYSAGSEYMNPPSLTVAERNSTALATDIIDGRLVEIPAASAKTVTSPTTLARPIADAVNSRDWILKQDADQYTIQYRSSPDKDVIFKDAKNFPFKDAVAVFPFKRTRNNHVVYGFSAGLYDSVASAKQAINSLPVSAQTHGTWIRSIGELQGQIAEIESD